MKLQHLNEVPSTMAHDSLVRQRFIAPGDLKSAIQTVNYVELAENESFNPHSHPDCEECFFVIEGEALAVINGEDHPLKKGDFLVVEANEEHTFHNTASAVFKYFQFRVLI
jgi:mannose-6-phosphate isomerase-like protein (cupin superfamily)